MERKLLIRYANVCSVIFGCTHATNRLQLFAQWRKER